MRQKTRRSSSTATMTITTMMMMDTAGSLRARFPDPVVPSGLLAREQLPAKPEEKHGAITGRDFCSAPPAASGRSCRLS
jgi:hypothetical protein